MKNLNNKKQILIKQVIYFKTILHLRKMELQLSQYIFNINYPCVFKNAFTESEGKFNSALKWTPEHLVELFNDEIFTFRIGEKSLNCNFS